MPVGSSGPNESLLYITIGSEGALICFGRPFLYLSLAYSFWNGKQRPVMQV